MVLMTFKCIDCGRPHEVTVTPPANAEDLWKWQNKIKADVTKVCSCKLNPEELRYKAAKFVNCYNGRANFEITLAGGGKIEDSMNRYYFEQHIEFIVDKPIRMPSFKRVNKMLADDPELLKWLEASIKQEAVNKKVKELRDNISTATYRVSVEGLTDALEYIEAIKEKEMLKKE